jgi:ribosomal protein L11 methyltransferase
LTEPAAPARWLELAVETDHEAAESVSELLSSVGFNQGVAIEEPFVQEPDGDNLAIDVSRRATVRTYIAKADANDADIERVRRGLWHLGQLRDVGELTVTTLDEEDWANAWKEYFRPLHASKRVVVRPPWYEYEARPGEVVVVLDPGMAFGTGTHPSTRLCLMALEEHLRTGDRVLDVGTGSGILAIAARKLGASHVDAVDTEPVAVRSAIENVARSGLSDDVSVVAGTVGADGPFPGQYDLVVANIIARVLIELHQPLIHAVRSDGLLLLSGIVEPREFLVREAFEPAGMTLLGRQQLEDWVSLVYRAPALRGQPGAAW